MHTKIENPIPNGPVDLTPEWMAWALRRVAERLTEGTLPLHEAFDALCELYDIALRENLLDVAVSSDLTQHVAENFPDGPTAPSVAVLALAYADLIDGNDVELSIVDADHFTGDPALGFARSVEKRGLTVDDVEDNIDDMLDMLDEIDNGERPSNERVRAAVGTSLRQMAVAVPIVDDATLDAVVLDADAIGVLAARAKLVSLEDVTVAAQVARKTAYTRENVAAYVNTLADMIEQKAQSAPQAA